MAEFMRENAIGQYPERPWLLVGFSMGGLVARALAKLWGAPPAHGFGNAREPTPWLIAYLFVLGQRHPGHAANQSISQRPQSK